jgi:hypothetical protein
MLTDITQRTGENLQSLRGAMIDAALVFAATLIQAMPRLCLWLEETQ